LGDIFSRELIGNGVVFSKKLFCYHPDDELNNKEPHALQQMHYRSLSA